MREGGRGDTRTYVCEHAVHRQHTQYMHASYTVHTYIRLGVEWEQRQLKYPRLTHTPYTCTPYTDSRVEWRRSVRGEPRVLGAVDEAMVSRRDEQRAPRERGGPERLGAGSAVRVYGRV